MIVAEDQCIFEFSIIMRKYQSVKESVEETTKSNLKKITPTRLRPNHPLSQHIYYQNLIYGAKQPKGPSSLGIRWQTKRPSIDGTCAIASGRSV